MIGFKVDAQTKAYAGLDAFQNSCAFLGIGCLLCYCGILRYLGYFQGYNILVLTISSAMPNVLKFLSCALTLYTGYVLCGWLVLGPFNDKFRTLTVTSETLFSLLNGDDMFNTFQMLEPRNNFNLIRPIFTQKLVYKISGLRRSYKLHSGDHLYFHKSIFIHLFAFLFMLFYPSLSQLLWIHMKLSKDSYKCT